MGQEQHTSAKQEHLLVDVETVSKSVVRSQKPQAAPCQGNWGQEPGVGRRLLAMDPNVLKTLETLVSKIKQ